MKWGSKPKYGNTWTVVDNLKFQSKLEARRYVQLKALLKAGEVLQFERQVKFDLVAGIRFYADFKVWWKDGRTTVEDVKGIETEAFVIKRKLFNHFHGETEGELVVLKSRDIR